MRKFIDILREAKLVDGYWSAPTASDLQALVAQHGDLRGVATTDEIFLGRAGHEVHFSMRNALGLQPLYGYDGNSAPQGFDFYAAPIEVHYEHETGADDPFEGRDDWGVTSPPAFVVGKVAIWVSENEHCLGNRQFARMVGKSLVTEKWVKTLPRDSGEGHYDIHLNPSRAEAFAMMKESAYNDLRGLVTPTDLYVWPASADIHYGALHGLGLEYDVDAVRILLDREGPFVNECDPLAYAAEDPSHPDNTPEQVEVMKRMREWTTDHPGLQRIYGRNYTLGCR